MERSSGRRWSKHVTETSDALDLQSGVFKLKSARAIAASLKRSAERSRRRKADPFRSAMSMLVFYINRGGKNLSAERRAVLERAKDELRAQFHKAAKKKEARGRGVSASSRRTRTRARTGTAARRARS